MPELLPQPAPEPLRQSLSALMINCVESGASLGFLAPMSTRDADEWWGEALTAFASGRKAIFVERNGFDVSGVVQVELADRPNARHRAEIQKLMVLPGERRQGVGRRLMEAAEKWVWDQGRSLLVLDTDTESMGPRFYESLGWTRVGTIPDFSARPHGGFSATTYYYKFLNGDGQ